MSGLPTFQHSLYSFVAGGPGGSGTAVVGCGWNGWLGSKVVSPVVAIVGRCPLDKRVGCEALPVDRLVGREGGIAQER